MKRIPDDPLRAKYLELCEEASEHIVLARNFAMKPGNAWLARGELAKTTVLISELENTLSDIEQADK